VHIGAGRNIYRGIAASRPDTDWLPSDAKENRSDASANWNHIPLEQLGVTLGLLSGCATQLQVGRRL